MNRHRNRYRAGALIAAACALPLSGCVGTGKAGAQVLKPWTWFSHMEASATDRAEVKRDNAVAIADAAREGLLKTAQSEAHKADLALAVAPESRPVEVARASASATVGALDQALGAMTVEQAIELRRLVSDLLSENAAIRADAEQRQASAIRELQTRSTELDEARASLADREAKLAAKQGELRAAFDRENALANQNRGMRWAVAGLGIMSAVAAVGFAYVRITTGGTLARVVAGIQKFRTSTNHDALDTILAQTMDTSDKARVRSIKTRMLQ